jgi:hypothetical protein
MDAWQKRRNETGYNRCPYHVRTYHRGRACPETVAVETGLGVGFAGIIFPAREEGSSLTLADGGRVGRRGPWNKSKWVATPYDAREWTP